MKTDGLTRSSDVGTVGGLTWVILGHNSGSNALGRALSMALVARELGSVEVWAAGTGNVWKGASQFPDPVSQFSGTRQFRAWLSQLPERGVVFWVSKGIASQERLVTVIRRARPHALILLDLDDDDAGLAGDFRAASLSNRVRLHPFRASHPRNIRRSQSAVAATANGLTFATEAVRRRYPAFRIPHVLIPHTRENKTSPRGSGSSQALRVGVFGTMRPHKGGDAVLEYMRANRVVEVHTFRNCGLGEPLPDDKNWIVLDPLTPLADAYARVDVALIPISNQTAASDAQLPAKLIDAMVAGVPIVATPTSAIQEVCGDAFVPLVASDTATIGATIERAYRSAIGGAGRQIYETQLSPPVLADRLRNYLRYVAHS